MTFWDTANRYNFGSGNSERVIGRWLKCNPDQRRNVIVATGGRARSIPGITPDGERVLTYREAIVLRDLPRSAVVIERTSARSRARRSWSLASGRP